MKLFTKQIDDKLYSQFDNGSDLANQNVVAKIFNPYGRGTWYLINSDPSDPDYIWAIVDLFEIEVGSVSRAELQNLRVPPYKLPLERDMSFIETNAEELLNGLRNGKTFAEGGDIAEQNKEMLENQAVQLRHHTEELMKAIEKSDDIEPWVITKAQRAATDLSDITHYLDGANREDGEDDIDDYDLGGKLEPSKALDAIYKSKDELLAGLKYLDPTSSTKYFVLNNEESGDWLLTQVNRGKQFVLDGWKYIGYPLMGKIVESKFAYGGDVKAAKGIDLGASFEKMKRNTKLDDYEAKFIMKMSGSTEQSASYWVDGIGGLSDSDKKELFGRIRKYTIKEEGQRDMPEWYGYGGEMADGGKTEDDKLEELSDYLDEEGIYGYTNRIHRIMMGRDKEYTPEQIDDYLKDPDGNGFGIYGYTRAIERIYEDDYEKGGYMDDGGETENDNKFYVGYNKGRGLGKGVFKEVYSNYEDAKREADKMERMMSGSSQQTAYYVSDKDGEMIRKQNEMADGGWIKSDKQEDFYYYSTPDKKIKTPFWYSVHEVKDIGSKETLHWTVERGGTNDMGYLRNYARKNFESKDEALKYAKIWEKEIANKYKWSGSKMAEGGNTSSPNSEFMKWFVDWSKSVNENVYVSISIPNEFSSPIKDGKGKIVILDVIEKKGDSDAKKYMNEILEKADEFGVSIYLEPIPRTHNLKSEEHKNKITKDYLIKYYQKFGFENTDGGFMVREPKMAGGGETGNDTSIKSTILGMSDQELEDDYGTLKVKGTYLGKSGEFHHFKKVMGKVVASFRSDDITGSGLKRNTQGIKIKSEDVIFENKMAGGGKVKFEDKVAAVKASLLKRKKVSPKVQKDYGKTYSPAEAEDSAKRIVGAMTAKERLMKILKKKKKAK